MILYLVSFFRLLFVWLNPPEPERAVVLYEARNAPEPNTPRVRGVQ